MQAEIISIGAELMSGAAVDTNSAWLSARLGLAGVPVIRHTTIGDDRDAIAAAVRQSADRVELIITTGGLGPTLDDMTREALAAVTGRPLKLDATSLEKIEAYFAGINRPMPATNRVQAMFPAGAPALPNEWGTAPGVRIELGRAAIFSLPGVPREMQAMFEHYIAPFVAERRGDSALAHRVLRTFGAGESTLAGQIEDIMTPGRNPAVGTTASEGVITVRIVARGATDDEASALADRDAALVRERFGPLVYGENDDTIASVAGRMLAERDQTVSTAESCTGGLIGKLFTDISGSSAYYVGGFVTYSNALKANLLGIDPDLIECEGAVSDAVARAMAIGCRATTGSDYAIAVTGVAGPTGGTAAKPVGLVYIALTGPDGTEVKECRFSDHLSREAIRDRTAKTALNMLRRKLIS